MTTTARKKQKMVEVVESALAGEFARAGVASANSPAAPDPEVTRPPVPKPTSFRDSLVAKRQQMRGRA